MNIRHLVMGGLFLTFTVASGFSDELPEGQKVFIRECSKCHEIGSDARNKIGPHLNGLFGRKAGSVADYKYYSSTNRDLGIVWNPENFSKFIQDPKGVMRGTNQIYNGLHDQKEIDELIKFLSAK